MAAPKTIDHPTATKGRARLEARITPEQKELFERAAALEGRTLTDFIVYHLEPVAEETIRERDILRLSPKDSEFFARALLETAEPSEHLREAYAEYRRRFGR